MLLFSLHIASPPTYVTMEELMKAADGVTNMALAHEIVVDPDFRFNMQQKPDNRYLLRHYHPSCKDHAVFS